MGAGSGVPVDGKSPNSSMTGPWGKGTSDDTPRSKDPRPGLTEGRIEVEHGGKLTGHGVSSENKDPPLLTMQLRLLTLSTGRLGRAPDRVEGTPKLSSYDILSISGSSSLGD